MAGGVNPFGFSGGVIPQAVRPPKRGPQDLPSAPFGFAPPPSKMQQTLAILNEYNPLPAFERLLKSPMALGGPISEQDIADGLMVSGAVTGGSAAAPKPRNALNMGIRAYHGSPHDFDEFSMSKIGTGEGNQAYGHGLYFAEKEGIAKSYRDALSGKQYVFNKDPSEIAAKHGQGVVDTVYNYEGDPKEIQNVIGGLRDAVKRNLAEFGVSDVSQLKPMYDGDLASATIKMAKNADSLEAAIKSGDIAPDPGRMYEVEINADPNAFLDWDKPLSEQPQFIQDAFKDIPQAPDIPGQLAVYRLGDRKLNNPDASKKMLEAGIPGIKYLDAGSRGNVNTNNLRGSLSMWENALKKTPNDPYAQQQVASLRQQLAAAEAPATRNYVVFDDKLISIVKKYGIAGASAMLGYNILEGMDPAQAEELQRIEGNQ
jgi:hypothetical protein